MHRWLILLLTLTLPAAGEEKNEDGEPPPKPIEKSLVTIVQDGTGRVWGWSYGHRDFSLVHLEGEQWVTHPNLGEPGMSLNHLVALPDGSVACFWGDFRNTKTTLSIHRGDQPPRLATFGATEVSEILLRRDGSLLLTGRGPLIVEISADDEVKVIPIPDGFYRPTAKRKRGDWDFHAPVCALEDGEQRVWLWTDMLSTMPFRHRVCNFLEYKNGVLTRRDVPGLDPDSDVSAMVSHDESHLWYAKLGAGIYSLDLRTMRSELITRPLPVRNGTDNVEYIEQIYCIGDERFALTCPRPTLLTEEWGKDEWFETNMYSAKRFYNVSARSGRLLRYRAGEWEEIISGVDLRPNYDWRERPLLLTPAGLLLASHESGPWLALRPGGKSPVLQGWETEFPLRQATRILPVDETHVRVCDRHAGEVRVVPIEPVREPAQPRQVSVLMGPWDPLQMDAKGNGWGFRDEWKVSKWDGAQWTDLPVPKEIAVSHGCFRWWVDDHDLGWYLSKEGPAAILNLATNVWKVYESWEAAAQAQLGRVPAEPRWGKSQGPILYSARGQIAFTKPVEGLHYFDGKVWKRTSMSQFPLPLNAGDRGSPSFRNGRLLNLLRGNFEYEYDDQRDRWAQWTDKNYWSPGAPGEDPFPEGCPLKELIGVPVLARGTSFLLGQDRRLYKAVPGRTIPVFPANVPSPFAYGGWLTGVEIDAKGGLLLQMNESQEEPHLCLYYHVPATLPVPIATARLADQAGPRVELSVGPTDPPAPEEVWFSWSLDDSPWHVLQREKEIVFKDLADGPHRLEVRAYNAELGTPRTPTVLEWQKGNDPDALVKRWIAAFERNGYQKRRAARDALRAKGTAALPVLRAAESKGSGDARAWVKSSIELIESDLERDRVK